MKASKSLIMSPENEGMTLAANLNRIWVVARKDVRDLLAGRFYMYVILVCVICVPFFAGAKDLLDGLTKQGASAAELGVAAQNYLNTLVYTLPVMLAMLICSVFSAYAILMDKTKRTFESLLATPLSLRQIWMGKTIGVALPGLLLGLVVSSATYLVIDFTVVAPTIGSIMGPSGLPLVSALIIAPLLVFLVVSLISLLQLIMTNPRIPSFAFTIIFFSIYGVTIIMKVSTGSTVALIYLGAAVALGITLTLLGRFLTNERTVLSSKG